MKIALFGLGYVGFTAACCLAGDGHEVHGVEIDPAKIADIRAGIAPFHEPGLSERLRDSLAAGRLQVGDSVEKALAGAEIALVCVGTPSGPGGAHDMGAIMQVTQQIATCLNENDGPPLTLAYRSTMRPGTARHLIAPLLAQSLGADWQTRVELAYHPEFLREAQAVEDYYHPAKIVIGTGEGTGSRRLEALYEDIDAPLFRTGFEEAELTKFVDNSWHAVKVAFANEIGRICQKLDVRAAPVHQMFVADTRLNISPHYTRPGGAFGGSCLPKDVRALQYIAMDAGANTHLIDSLLRSNEAHKHHQFHEVMSRLPEGGRLLLAGLAFKAGTDDLRESPNVDLARKLLESGVNLRIFDPGLSAARLRGRNLSFARVALPTMDELLVSRDEAEAAHWDLVVANNACAQDLSLPHTPVLRTDLIA